MTDLPLGAVLRYGVTRLNIIGIMNTPEGGGNKPSAMLNPFNLTVIKSYSYDCLFRRKPFGFSLHIMTGVISNPVTSYKTLSITYAIPLYVKLEPFSGMCMVLIGNVSVFPFTLKIGCIPSSIAI